MSAPRDTRRGSALRGASYGLLLLACCGGGGTGQEGNTPISVLTPPAPAKPPCGLSSSTTFADDPKFAKNLGLFKPPEEPSADELDGHCRAVWQEVVEDRHCGQVVIPEFCKTCTDVNEKQRCFEGNGRGLVTQRCREASLKTFNEKYPACKDFVLCAGKIQLKTLECKAARQ